MIKAVAIDDEKHILENLDILLKENCPEIELIGTATSALEGIKTIVNLKPDVIFLDISMPHGSGFDLLDSIGTIDFQVVFVTAYDRYAIEAIKRNAIDYLLKPIQISELKKCVKKLQNEHSPQNESNRRITIRTNDSIEFIRVDEIVYCRSDNSYCHVYVSSGNHYFFSKQLKDLEFQLPKNKFIRCHNSYIINKNYTSRYTKQDGGALELTTGAIIPIARARKEAVLSWLEK